MLGPAMFRESHLASGAVKADPERFPKVALPLTLSLWSFGVREEAWRREMPFQSAVYPMGSPWEITVVPRLGRDGYDKAILALTAAGTVGTFLGLVVAR